MEHQFKFEFNQESRRGESDLDDEELVSMMSTKALLEAIQLDFEP